MELKTNADDKAPAVIGKVTFSRTRKTIYYRDKTFRRYSGGGVYGGNYYDVDTREEYWISAPKKNGQDRLRGGTVRIDKNVEDRYWTEIRGME
jgi:hypothetical protein